MWSADAQGGAAPASSATQLASSAVRLATAHYRALLFAVGIVLVPTLVVGAAALGYWRAQTYSGGRVDGTARVAEVVGLVVIVLGSFLAQAAGAQAVTSAAVGAQPDWWASCRSALRQSRAVVLTGLAVSVMAGLGLLLFVVPGVVLWLTWYVTMPVVVMEGANTRGALRRSASLVGGRRLTILGAFLLVEVLVLACSLPVGAIAGALFSHSGLGQVIAEQVAAYAVEILLTPLQVALVLVVYLELRFRHDGARPLEVARAAGIPARQPEPSSWPPPAAGGAAPSWQSPPGPDAADHAPPARPQPAPGAVGPAAGPGSPGWPGVSPKPSQDRPTRFSPPASWPQLSPKPAPPVRGVASPGKDADPRRDADSGPSTSSDDPEP